MTFISENQSDPHLSNVLRVERNTITRVLDASQVITQSNESLAIVNSM
jgi:hypothetical protein